MAEEGQKLLPCPFCGGEAERVDVPAEADYDDGAGGSFIQCRRCVASTGLHYEFKENLVSSWNDRAKPLPAVERTIANEALRRAAEAVEQRAVEVGRQECCGHGVGYGEHQECCGSPDFVITDRDAATAIRALIKEPGHE